MVKKPSERFKSFTVTAANSTKASAARSLMSAAQLQALLDRAQRSQRGTAKDLGLSERQMRRYAAGTAPIPKVVEFALLYYLGWAVEIDNGT
jgi:hypothetical protein